MPFQAKLTDQRPNHVRGSRKLDGIGDSVQVRVRRREIRKFLHAWLGCPGRAALHEFAIAVDEPSEEDVDRVRVDRTTSSGLVSTSGDRALLDLEVTLVGDRFGNVEQQKIIEEDI